MTSDRAGSCMCSNKSTFAFLFPMPHPANGRGNKMNTQLSLRCRSKNPLGDCFNPMSRHECWGASYGAIADGPPNEMVHKHAGELLWRDRNVFGYYWMSRQTSKCR